jgi:hypothetical protein
MKKGKKQDDETVKTSAPLRPLREDIWGMTTQHFAIYRHFFTIGKPPDSGYLFSEEQR